MLLRQYLGQKENKNNIHLYIAILPLNRSRQLKMFAINVRVLHTIRLRWDPVNRRAQNRVGKISEARVGERLGKDICKTVIFYKERGSVHRGSKKMPVLPTSASILYFSLALLSKN